MSGYRDRGDRGDPELGAGVRPARREGELRAEEVCPLKGEDRRGGPVRESWLPMGHDHGEAGR